MDVIISQLELCVEITRNGEGEYDRIVSIVDRLLDIIETLDIDSSTLVWVQQMLNALIDRIIYTLHSVPCSRGRPKLQVGEQLLHDMFDLGFNITSISKILGVSRMTLYRRLNEHNMSIQRYTPLTDDQLAVLVADVVREYPNSGYRRIDGYLKSRGCFVKQQRLRRAVKYVDPSGVYQRCMASRVIVRRKYFVAKANDIWHIDTHMKLIRWNFVVRGGIDGKSRLITFLEADDNNRAINNLHAFIEATQRYGLPSRTRTDKGLENIDLARYMLLRRGTSRGSHICGRSVHNQRIERLWSDVFHGLLVTFHALFSDLELHGQLDVSNSKHMAALHYVFLPRINKQLQEFAEGWNAHPLSTENNLCPKQLFLLHIQPDDYADSIDERNQNNWNQFVNEIEDLENIFPANDITNPQMPRHSFTDSELQRLSSINFLQDSSSYGADIYSHALHIL